MGCLIMIKNSIVSGILIGLITVFLIIVFLFGFMPNGYYAKESGIGGTVITADKREHLLLDSKNCIVNSQNPSAGRICGSYEIGERYGKWIFSK